MDKGLLILGAVAAALCLVMGVVDMYMGNYLWAGFMAICVAMNANTFRQARDRIQKKKVD